MTKVCVVSLLKSICFFLFSGYGTEQNYEAAATHYKYATEQSQNPQAMFNLAYMHANGLGLKRVRRTKYLL